MSQDKEREIQLQFLEEAQEYLDTIESFLLELSHGHIEGQQMDAVLRAAHSVKGGAGMMGYQTLSQLAHRLEDSFKILKAQKNSIKVDDALLDLLLAAVDRLCQVLEHNRRGTDVDEQWLQTVGNPVFEKLHERLGDPVADDAATMLGAEDGTNVAALLFETEVEGCLSRLESVLADSLSPCLGEELEIMAQELGGLGEMLQLDAFTQLCESIIGHLQGAPERVKEIASASLLLLRRSQALVLVGQTGSLPRKLEIEGVSDGLRGLYEVEDSSVALESGSMQGLDAVSSAFSRGSVVEDEGYQGGLSEVFHEDSWREARVFEEGVSSVPEGLGVGDSCIFESRPILGDLVEEGSEQFYSNEDDSRPSVEVIVFPESSGSDDRSSLYTSGTTDAGRDVSEIGSVSPESSPVSLQSDNDSSSKSFLSGQVFKGYPTGVESKGSDSYGDESGRQRFSREKFSGAAAKDSSENTVRIPVRQLDVLNDLFGELTIERNGLSLHLARLRNLIDSLRRRVSALEQSNIRLRAAYDTVATQSVISGYSHSNNHNLATQAFGDNKLATNIIESNSLISSFIPIVGQLDEKNPRSSFSHYPLNKSNPQSLNFSHPLFDSLEMDRYSDLHLLSIEIMETIVQIQEATSDIGLTLEDTDQTARELNQTAKQLQSNLTRVRMRPLSDLVGRYSRALRDLSLQYGKQVELKVYGKGTLIDRSILEALSDPLMHLVRNAFDHGIESPTTREAQGKPKTGIIEIKAAHRGNQTIITVSDDGNGINLEKIRHRAEAMGLDAGLLAAASADDLLSLIFEPGFSTAEQVTALSGRGVGMDVVRNNLKQIRGDIRVDTQPGQGTTFTLTVPFTLSVARVLLVESNGMLLAFPTDVIEEMLLLRPEDVLTTPGSEVLKWDGEMVPLTRLGSWLLFNCQRRVTTLDGAPTISEPTVLMISQGDQLQALQVDRCWGEREVAIRQVEGTLPMPPGFAGCTILGDGKVVPLVDALSLLRWIATRAINSPPSQNIKATSNRAAHKHPLPTVASIELMSEHFAARLEGDIAHDSVSLPGLSPPVFPQVLFDNVRQKDTILVVDDSINVRRFLALALEKAGYLVEQAKDGQDAVEKLLGGTRVAAVICDIEMPRLDGYGFLARVKSDPTLSLLPIAMLTSRSGDKHRQLAMTLGAAAYFSKPYNERELLATIKDVITENRSRKPIPSAII
jgi:chemotaxis family two-component system sensor histidine kinase/response regulator PixL